MKEISYQLLLGSFLAQKYRVVLVHLVLFISDSFSVIQLRQCLLFCYQNLNTNCPHCSALLVSCDASLTFCLLLLPSSISIYDFLSTFVHSLYHFDFRDLKVEGKNHSSRQLICFCKVKVQQTPNTFECTIWIDVFVDSFKTSLLRDKIFFLKTFLTNLAVSYCYNKGHALSHWG